MWAVLSLAMVYWVLQLRDIARLQQCIPSHKVLQNSNYQTIYQMVCFLLLVIFHTWSKFQHCYRRDYSQYWSRHPQCEPLLASKVNRWLCKPPSLKGVFIVSHDESSWSIMNNLWFIIHPWKPLFTSVLAIIHNHQPSFTGHQWTTNHHWWMTTITWPLTTTTWYGHHSPSTTTNGSSLSTTTCYAVTDDITTFHLLRYGRQAAHQELATTVAARLHPLLLWWWPLMATVENASDWIS